MAARLILECSSFFEGESDSNAAGVGSVFEGNGLDEPREWSSPGVDNGFPVIFCLYSFEVSDEGLDWPFVVIDSDTEVSASHLISSLLT